MRRKAMTILLSAVTVLSLATGCGASKEDATATAGAVVENEEAAADEGDTVVLRGIADLVPHSELIEFVTPKLAEQGIQIELVSTAADSTTNEKLDAGEIDFNFFQHDPYLQSHTSNP